MKTSKKALKLVASKGPLTGVRVLDIGTAVAGPGAAMLMGDFGAEVIKIELPKTGEPERSFGPWYEGKSLSWTFIARNKLCITLDVRKPRGQEVFKKLVAVSDIVVENFRAGSIEKWNIGYDVLHEVNKGLILVRCSGFGQKGPYKSRAGYDRTGQAMGGSVYVTGHPDSLPVRCGLSIADWGTSVYAALGGMMALYYRDTSGTGEGQVVDIALYEPVLRMMGGHLAHYQKSGVITQRRGNVAPNAVPGDLFETKDGGMLNISAGNDQMFARLAKAIGHEELAKDPRFDTAEKRSKNIPFLNNVVREWVAQRSLAEASQVMEKAEVNYGPVYSARDIVEDAAFRQRGSVIEVDDLTMGKVVMPGIMPKLSLTPGEVRHTGKELGVDTYLVLSQLLPFSDDEIDSLKKEEII